MNWLIITTTNQSNMTITMMTSTTMTANIRKTRAVTNDNWLRIVSRYRFFSEEDMCGLPVELRTERSWRPLRCEDDALGLPTIMVSAPMYA